MKTFTFVLDPLEFHIESECETPLEALKQALQCGTPNETFLLEYLSKNIDDHPSINDSVECIEVSED